MNVFGMVTTKGSSAYTPYALRSFFASTPVDSGGRFFLIDNDGAHAGRPPLSSLPPAMTVLRNPAPLGFAANVNQIMRFAAEHRADLYFLNNDLIFTPHWLDPLLLPEPAILAPVSNWRSHPRQGGFVCTPTMDLSDYLGHEADLVEIARRHRLELSGHPRRFSEWFFCVKIPHVVYSKVGFLDERFGRGGGEDCDYCLRAHLAGFGVRLALQSFVLHFMGKSTWRGAETSEQQRNRESHYRHAFIRKWGQDLFDLMLGGGQAPLQRNPAALASFNAGDYRSVVRQLMPPDAIPDALVLA